MSSNEQKIPFSTQLKIVFTDKYMIVIFVYFLIYMFASSLKNLGLVYYCNYVLGSYNDGITQMMVSVIGGVPMGIGIFAVWPLAKRFGKRNVTLWGFILYAIGSAICWMIPTSLSIVLVGQFIKNIGGLPCAYVFMALFADGLDHVEWKSGVRCDGTAMSIYNIIAVAIVGVATSAFNAMLSSSGYIAPDLIDGVTVAYSQPEMVSNLITFSFVGLESITGIILAGLLVFLTVEKTIARKQAKIREYQQAEATARGEEWIAPEIKAARDEEQFILEAEENFVNELKERCEKKGLNFDEELEAHQEEVYNKQQKQAEKKRIAEEKAAAKAKILEEKKAVRLAKLTPEQLAQKEEKTRKRAEKEDAAWETELAKGEAYRAKIQAEIKAKTEKAVAAN
jgi:hypothetical protein